MKKFLAVALGGLLVGVIVGFALPHEKTAGGTFYNRIIDFGAGIDIAGSHLVDSSLNITAAKGTFTKTLLGQATTGNNVGAGTASSVAVLTTGNESTSTIVFGSANKPVCIAAYGFAGGITANSNASTVYYYQFTPTGVQALVTKPTTCP